MKRMIVLIVVGVVVLLAGVGGGIFVGLKFFSQPDVVPGSQGQPPGPTVRLGEFTVNLADKEPHVLRTTITLEVTSQESLALVADPGWLSRMRNEVILVGKDRRYDDLRTAEGVLEFAQDVKRRLNALMPLVKGQPAVSRVLFDDLIVQ